MTLAEYRSGHDGSFKETNLVFLRRGDQILLAMKKRGFGVGRWNGAGGKLEPGEGFEAAARREVNEEIGVKARDLREVACLKFYWDIPEHPMKNVLCKVYECWEWTGEPTESEEMAPRWFELSDIPYDEMWADDELWLPMVLEGKYVEAELLFDADDSVLDKLVEARG